MYKKILFLVVATSTLALFGNVMEPDSALYASIAKSMVLRNDWVNLYVRGADWLDKPHLTFWLAAISFKIFGITGFAYKFMSFLFGLLGAWYVYKLAKSIYTEKIAITSVIIFLTALHILISTFDTRAEVYITTFTLAAIYHYFKAQSASFWHIVAGSFFAACAIMIKGIFVLFPVFGGFILYWLLSKQFSQLLKIKWWIAIVLILLFITPELYTLYVQWDLHPEKLFFGKPNTSGIKFFFWDSQFGRFFNNGPIKGKGDKLFFFHTTLWAFLPWSILFYSAIVSLFKKKNRVLLAPESILIWGSAGITFLLFSLSKFQLPHYILIILPQFAIITAVYLDTLSKKGLNVFFYVQEILGALLMALLLGLNLILDGHPSFWILIAVIGIYLASKILLKGKNEENLVARSAVISVCLMIFISLYFYPSILKYESGAVAAQWLNKNHPAAKASVLGHPDAYSFDFYATGEVEYFWTKERLAQRQDKKNLVIYVSEAELNELKNVYAVHVLKDFSYYHTTKLTPKFLNAHTRHETLERFFLITIE
ncbi:ArnT family glycosyltransferase [Pedobacter sp. MW01-1-1]|uniref:ArnT family glycosyltransferase n=1 Tax=Pedobacter sp. MW01-1-1 TaxID=3383027 RepID=UPI003FF12617